MRWEIGVAVRSQRGCRFIEVPWFTRMPVCSDFLKMLGVDSPCFSIMVLKSVLFPGFWRGVSGKDDVLARMGNSPDNKSSGRQVGHVPEQAGSLLEALLEALATSEVCNQCFLMDSPRSQTQHPNQPRTVYICG